MSAIWAFLHMLVDQFRQMSTKGKIIIVCVICLCVLGSIYLSIRPALQRAAKQQKEQQKLVDNQPIAVTYDIMTEYITQGQPFTVNVNISGNNNVYDESEMTLQYDASVMKPLGIIPGNVFPHLPVKEIGKNTIQLKGKYDQTKSQKRYTGTIATISFLALRQTSGTTLYFDESASHIYHIGQEIPSDFLFTTVRIKK